MLIILLNEIMSISRHQRSVGRIGATEKAILMVQIMEMVFKLCCRQNEHFCPSRDIARQASVQTMCISSERSSLVGFDAIFVEFFGFCKLTDLFRDYRPYYDIFLIPL